MTAPDRATKAIIEIQASLTAMDVVITAISGQLDLSELKADYKAAKETTLTALLNNAAASDQVLALVEARLRGYERSLGLDEALAGKIPGD